MPTRLNPFTGKQERVTRNPLAPIRMDARRPRRGVLGMPGTIGGLRKRRTTPGGPFKFGYGWESVYGSRKR